ncbi:MAG: hypothetical protein KL863_10320 [Rhizobium sp.]|nr:hypothetical protein [Rhizobium sp.]
MQDFPAFEAIEGNAELGLLILADHATNRLPAEYGDLGLQPSSFERHIAYDIGVEPLTRALAAARRRLDPDIVGYVALEGRRLEPEVAIFCREAVGGVVGENQQAEFGIALYGLEGWKILHGNAFGTFSHIF